MNLSYSDYFQSQTFLDNGLQSTLLNGTNLLFNGKALTRLDLFNLPFSSEPEIEGFLATNFGIDLNTKEGLDYANKLLERSIAFFEQTLLRHYGRTMKRKFNTKKEVLSYIKKVKETRSSSQASCCVLKIAQAIDDVLSNPKLTELDSKMEFLLKSRFCPGVYLEDSNFPTTSNYGNGKYLHLIRNFRGDAIDFEEIPFKVMFRHKQYDKTVLKMLYNANYTSSSEVKDLFGIRIEVESEEKALYMLEYLYHCFFNQEVDSIDIPELGDIEDAEDALTNPEINFGIKNKNLISLETFSRLKDKISDQEFRFELERALTYDSKKKAVTSTRYRDIKIFGDILIPQDLTSENSPLEKHGLEVQIVLVNNRNETGLSHHAIFDAKKIISSMIRLQGYVSLIYIESVIDKILKDNPDLMMSKEKIIQHFLETFLLKITFGSNSIYYTTRDRYKALKDTAMYGNNFMVYDYKNGIWK